MMVERATGFEIFSNPGSERVGNLSGCPSFGSSAVDDNDAIDKRKYTLNDWWAATEEEETTYPGESDAEVCCVTVTDYDSDGSPTVVYLKPQATQASLHSPSSGTEPEGEPDLERRQLLVPAAAHRGEPSAASTATARDGDGEAPAPSTAEAEEEEQQVVARTTTSMPRLRITGTAADAIVEAQGAASLSHDESEPLLLRRPPADRTGPDPQDKGFWDFFWVKLNASCCMSEA